MFSGLTNQFTSLVGAVKGGQADEDVPAPTGDATAVAAPAADASAAAVSEQDPTGEQLAEGEEGAKRSSSLVDSLLTEATGWLGSAKGWLGSASIPSMPAMPTMAMPSMPAMPAMPSIPSIPGLRKSGADAGEGADADGQADITGAVSGEDEDKSRYISATEGADSHPASGGGTPTGEEGQIGQVTTKVTQQAKHFGSFLSSAINKAGAKIKETVKDNTILDSFNKEQEAFIKGQGGSESGAAPWIGHNNEAKIKEEILGLAQDRRNFVRAPPAGVDFEFNYDTAYPTAIAIMAEDKALETMRFELVPKIITEENFWRNYFYRVSLIIQAAELGTLGADGVGAASSEDAIQTKYSETNSIPTTSSLSTVAEAGSLSSAVIGKSNENQIKANVKNSETQNRKLAKSQQQQQQQLLTQSQKLSESEFVSDAFQTTNESSDLAEIKDGMRRLGIDSMTQEALSDETNEEQWEKDLEAELKDYEVVSDGGGGGGGAGGGGGSSSSVKLKTDSIKSKKRGKNVKGKKSDTDTKTGTAAAATAIAAAASADVKDDDDDEIPTISNLRTRTSNNDWEEYADLIEDTDDLKTLKSLKRSMLGYQRSQEFFTLF